MLSNGKHRLDALSRDFARDNDWENVVQYSLVLEPGHFIRYTSRDGQEYEVVDA
jgi:hypothetical protein